MFKEIIKENMYNALIKAIEENKMGEMKAFDGFFVVEKPKNPDFGDFSVNVSPLARNARMAPPKIAEAICEYLDIEDVDISIMGGFINFKLGSAHLNSVIKKITAEKKQFGKNNIGNSEKVMIEYVSANPTGPLHIGHGRWAAMGSALANLMAFSGYDVSQEFYINDAGGQINNLAKSLWIRVLQQLGSDVQIPTEGEEAKGYYPGDYLIETAKDFLVQNKEKAENWKNDQADPFNPSDEILNDIAAFAKLELLNKQKELLKRLKVDFNSYFSESTLHNRKEVDACVEALREKGKIYEKEGAVWFKSSEYGDDQDRVIKKTDGSNTYLTSDIAYHYDKLKRGFDRLINIWGADHHGYVARMKAAIEALGYDPQKLEVLLGQLVNLVIGGEQVRMGKRKKMITLEELVNDVGVDATRYWMIMRSIDTTLDFDVDLAKSNSDDNPVFYVQYAHARACSILKLASNPRLDQHSGESLPAFFNEKELDQILNDADLELEALWNDENEKALNATKALILKLESFQEVVKTATQNRAPYIIARYAQELAGVFHHFYTFARVLNVENSLMKSRLSLVNSTRQVLANCLDILGVSAPKKM